MKKGKLVKPAQLIIANAVLKSAKTASTNYCFWIIHQPKVPVALRNPDNKKV